MIRSIDQKTLIRTSDFQGRYFRINKNLIRTDFRLRTSTSSRKPRVAHRLKYDKEFAGVRSWTPKWIMTDQLDNSNRTESFGESTCNLTVFTFDTTLPIKRMNGTYCKLSITLTT